MVSITDIIDPFWFIVSFCVGLFYVYCMYRNPDVIIKYPTPEDAHQTIFKDDADNCYRFQTKEVDCPKNPLSVHTIPVQRKVEYFDSPTQTNGINHRTLPREASYPFDK